MLERLINKPVRYKYSLPTTSCCTSRVRHNEGLVLQVDSDAAVDFPGPTLLVDTGFDVERIHPQEITHVRTGKQWRKRTFKQKS